MKIKIISFIVLANLFALIFISAIINRTSFKKQTSLDKIKKDAGNF